MTLTTSTEQAERQLIGQALRNLRDRAGKHQHHVATPLGISTQAWQKYEAGERKFTEERIDEVLDAIGASRDDLEAEKARILGTPRRSAEIVELRRDFTVEVFGRPRSGPQGPEVYDVSEAVRRLDLRQVLGGAVAAMEMAGDSMWPWASGGELVLFDRDRYPRRGGGCVVELQSGSAHVKLYEKSDGSTLFVKELFPEERTITFPLSEVKGVYAVRLRGD